MVFVVSKWPSNSGADRLDKEVSGDHPDGDRKVYYDHIVVLYSTIAGR